MGKIKDAIKESFSRKAPEPAPKPQADPPPADPAVEAAKQRFLKVSERFMAGGCTRAELDAAREEAGG